MITTSSSYKPLYQLASTIKLSILTESNQSNPAISKSTIRSIAMSWSSGELAKHVSRYRKNDETDLVYFENLISTDSTSLELRSEHECCHAVRAILLGGVVETVTPEFCEVSGLRTIKDHLQYRIAGLCAEFLFKRRRKLSPDPDVYKAAIDAVRWRETEHAHDLHNFFSLLLKVNPLLTDDELILHADLEIAECEQILRHPDHLAALQRCARALRVKRHLRWLGGLRAFHARPLMFGSLGRRETNAVENL